MLTSVALVTAGIYEDSVRQSLVSRPLFICDMW
jgi:hypothetical protein